MAVLVCIPTNSVRGFPFLHTPVPEFIACRLLDHSHSDWCEMVLHCGFDLHFSDNEYAKYIMRNVGLEETQAGMKIAWKNINNLRYADDTTLMAESEEELKSLLMKVKEGVKKLA